MKQKTLMMAYTGISYPGCAMAGAATRTEDTSAPRHPLRLRQRLKEVNARVRPRCGRGLRRQNKSDGRVKGWPKAGKGEDDV